jgi:threonine-phosphate decarboxylase
VNSLAQVAGLASLADDGYRRETLACVAREREALAGALAALPGLKPYPSAANYLLVEITGSPDAPELARRLLADRILIRDCSSFVGLGTRFFRVAVRTEAEHARLLDSLGQACSR